MFDLSCAIARKSEQVGSGLARGSAAPGVRRLLSPVFVLT